MKGYSIVGRKRNDGIDFYQTPIWATQGLLNKEHFDGNILEPCSGNGAISKVLIDNGYNVVSSDIRQDDKVFGFKNKNIFDYQNNTFDNIITNPPYNQAQEIIEKSLLIAKYKVCMLLKLCFLESERRYNFFKSSPLKSVYVFCKRVQMYPEGIEKPKNSGTIAYAWYIWDKSIKDSPIINWIK